jgi:hypothetical protein
LGELEKRFEGSGVIVGSFSCFRPTKKCDFGEFERAIFQGIAWPLALIFCLMAGPKCDLGEVDKPMF